MGNTDKKGNTILIKHGQALKDEDDKIIGLPSDALKPYELGFCDSNNLLYIGTNSGAIPIIPVLENMSGVLGIEHGGTGATTPEEARNNLGTNNAANITTGTLDINRLPTISIEKGGTGAITPEGARKNLGAFGSCIYVQTANTDLNDYKDEGWYFFTTTYTPLNIPGGANGFLQVVDGRGDKAFIKQIFYRAGTPGSNDYMVWFRTYTTAVGWGDWAEIYTSKHTIPISNGGTGATTESEAATKLKVLPLAGGKMNGLLTLLGDQYYNNDKAGLDCANSDIIRANGIYFADKVDSPSEGIHFANGSNWDTLYAVNGELKFHGNKTASATLAGKTVVHTGNHFTSLASGKDVTTTGNSFTINNVGEYSAFLFYAQGNTSTTQSWMSAVYPKALLGTSNKKLCITDGNDIKYFNVSINSSNVMTVTAAGHGGLGITATSFGVYGIR